MQLCCNLITLPSCVLSFLSCPKAPSLFVAHAHVGQLDGTVTEQGLRYAGSGQTSSLPCLLSQLLTASQRCLVPECCCFLKEEQQLASPHKEGPCSVQTPTGYLLARFCPLLAHMRFSMVTFSGDWHHSSERHLQTLSSLAPAWAVSQVREMSKGKPGWTRDFPRT